MWNGQRNNLYRTTRNPITRPVQPADRNHAQFNLSSDNQGADLAFFQEFKSEQDPNGTIYWYHYDGEGNIAGTTKHKAQSDHTYRYDEYGLTLPDNGTGLGQIGSDNTNGGSGWDFPHNQYTLTQKYADPHTNLTYFGSRHYDPEMGVWLTQDSYRGAVPNPQSLHRYMYNYASPVNYQDWYGYFVYVPPEAILTEDRLKELYGEEKYQEYKKSTEETNKKIKEFGQNIWNKLPAAITCPDSPIVKTSNWVTSQASEYENYRYKTYMDGKAYYDSIGITNFKQYKQYDWDMTIGFVTMNMYVQNPHLFSPAQSSTPNKTTLNRPYLRKGTIETIESNAMRNTQGQFIDPNTNLVIKGKYDVGHVTGQEFFRMKNWAEIKGMTQSQFNNYSNNPSLYQIESPITNRSHLFEDPSPIQFYTPIYKFEK